MRKCPTVVAVAIAALLGSQAASAQESSGPEFRFSGFGTFGLVHSDNDGADFINSRFAANGAGYTHSTTFTPDTKGGLQLDVKFGDRVSAVVQVVTQHQYDNSFNPQVEWANVKFKATDSLSLRAGRIALPAYALSESRFVGYSYTAVRPSVDVYSVLPVTSSDGVDFNWRTSFGEANNALQGFYGTTELKGPAAELKAKQLWGFTDTLDFGSFTARASYLSAKLDVEIPSLDPLYTSLLGFADSAQAIPLPPFQAAAASALSVYDQYKLNDMNVSAYSVGLTYDPGNWFVSGEYVGFKGKGFIGDVDAWTVMGGYRFGAWTPYLGYAEGKTKAEHTAGIATDGLVEPFLTGAVGLNAGVNAVADSFAQEQRTATVGVRWDVVRNVALKAQYDRIDTNGTYGRFIYGQPGFDGKVNLLSVAVDVVF